MPTIDELERRANAYLNAARPLFPDTELPAQVEVRLGLRGRVAGRAFSKRGYIILNDYLLETNEAEMLSQVLPHEVAHIIAHAVAPYDRAHGYWWQRVMQAFGLEPDRLHHMKTVPARKVVRIPYSCDCGRVKSVTAQMHRRILKGEHRYCRTCRATVKHNPAPINLEDI